MSERDIRNNEEISAFQQTKNITTYYFLQTNNTKDEMKYMK
jgi:hypothetical protein